MVNLCFQPFNKRKNRRVIFVKMAKKKNTSYTCFVNQQSPLVKFEFFTADTANISLFWAMTPYTVVDKYRRFGRKLPQYSL